MTTPAETGEKTNQVEIPPSYKLVIFSTKGEQEIIEKLAAIHTTLTRIEQHLKTIQPAQQDNEKATEKQLQLLEKLLKEEGQEVNRKELEKLSKRSASKWIEKLLDKKK